MVNAPDGYVLITGRSGENARAALEAAEKVGAAVTDVRTTTNGYLVPEAVAQYLEGTWEAEAEPKAEPATKKRRTRKSKASAKDTTETENKE